MNRKEFPEALDGLHIHLVGAKGTGMTALAEILHHNGAILSGSDVPDVFYTDTILSSLGVKLASPFDVKNLPPDADLVIYSAAYSIEGNPELSAAHEKGIPIFSYPEALGALSAHSESAGIAGVHGKTTTTAFAGLLIKALELPATVLAGSAVANFDDRCTFIHGNTYFIAETCEYRKHFLNFKPRWIVITSVESDHQDYFPTYEAIRDAFLEYVMSLPQGGTLVYCADEKGAVEVADLALQKGKIFTLLSMVFSLMVNMRFRISTQIEEQILFRSLDGQRHCSFMCQGDIWYSMLLQLSHSLNKFIVQKRGGPSGKNNGIVSPMHLALSAVQSAEAK